VMAGAATSQRTAAVPAKAPGAARLGRGARPALGGAMRSLHRPCSPALCFVLSVERLFLCYIHIYIYIYIYILRVWGSGLGLGRYGAER